MLVIKRKIGESIVISHDIKIIVLEAKDRAVKLGIQAPISVFIYRQEIYSEIKKILGVPQANKEFPDKLEKLYQHLQGHDKQLENYFISTTKEEEHESIKAK